MQAYYADYMGEFERRRDEMVRAESHRQRRMVAKEEPSVVRIHQRLLARLGARLVVWGCQLQTRFAVEGSASA